MIETLKPKKHKRTARPKETRYYISISSWEASCGITTHISRNIQGSRYLENFGATIRGTMLYPKQYQRQPVELTVSGDRGMVSFNNGQPTGSFDALPIGWLTNRKRQNCIWCRLPQYVMSSVLQLLSSGHFRFIGLSGEYPTRGDAEINMLNLFPRMHVYYCPEIDDDPILAAFMDSDG